MLQLSPVEPWRDREGAGEGGGGGGGGGVRRGQGRDSFPLGKGENLTYISLKAYDLKSKGHVVVRYLLLQNLSFF